jgi:hypothetical protein
LLRQIASDLTYLKEGSPELRNAHFNLANIRAALAQQSRRDNAGPNFEP